MENMGRMISLNGSNYHLWKGKMEDLLFVKEFHVPVFEEKKPVEKTDDQWKLQHRQVCGLIRQWVDDNVLNHIENEIDARSLWLKLEQLYARKTGNDKMYMIKKLIELRMSLCNSTSNGVISMDMVKNSVLNEETRRQSNASSSRSDVLVTESRGRSSSRDPKKDKNRSRSKSNKFANLECHYCHKKGHIKKDCWKLKKDKQQGKQEEVDRVTITDDQFLILLEDDAINVCQDTSWVVDSGATTHATSQRDLFSTYTPGSYGSVKMGNDGLAQVVGIGDICLETSIGTRLMLKDVKHVPDLRMNLISTRRLDDEGFYSLHGGGKWKLSRGSLVVARGEKLSSFYLMQAKVSKDSVNALENDHAMELWHKRLGHMSEKGMSVLSKKEAIPRISGLHLEKCAHCLRGKQHMVSFKSSVPSRKPKVLDLVHSDVCGPMKTKSLGGASYFVTFIDDHSRKLWVFTMRTKDQVLGYFKQFVALVERQTGKKLKCIRSDNGGEYSGPFDVYCKEHGIRHQFTPPKTPQLNGLAERMNRTIVERMRCLISQSGLAMTFWGEALSTVVHVLNLSPSAPLEGDIPERVWTGKNVSYGHLRVFGCKAFVHIPKDERSKLEMKSRQCVFIGYGQDEFGYRFYDPVKKKLIRSRDVVFMEDQTIKDIDKSGNPTQSYESLIDSVVAPSTSVHGHVEDEVQVDTPGADAPAHDDGIGDHDDDHGETPTTENPPIVRRSERGLKPSTRYDPSEYVLLTDGGEPESFDEALEDEHKDEWHDAMGDEMDSFAENHTFELVKLPKGKKALLNKWVYKIKHDETSLSPRYKARLVVKGYGQKKGIDYDEIFSPVVKMSSIRVVLGLAASLDLEVEQMDVKTAFLHGDLEEEIYMVQPEGFMKKGKEDLVCRLKKSLYGLKQAPRQWYKKFESVMGEHGYKKTTSDHCVFVQMFGEDDFIVLLLYVDDMLIVGKNLSRIQELKNQLGKSFAMKDLGPAKQILGMRIVRDRGEKLIYLSQERYIEKVLQRFHMDNSKVVSTPLATHFRLNSQQSPKTKLEKEDMARVSYASAVGSLMYAMVCTRPDIAHAVGTVSRFLSNPGREHWNAVKWILRYLRGTS
ncbi:Zinc finger CCHC-type superfamily [Arabidopsis thaliana x Arabidopsis arenosa]|uniref:Zinc finger CCHC-type superfamily n=1 Tax=Arabidopsis thaliana x Arabidopsis arenosa TaxID=1240361 RepID=A0A8T1Z4D1_9BRAS|nr:Zinc finger CCHC-type superfamily [Arabidopsis thaliana x Arabidopsis arenosa]